jgi:hypothetical protein
MNKIALILFMIVIILIVPLVSCDDADEEGFVPLNEGTSARFYRIGIEKFVDVHDGNAIDEVVYYVDRSTNIVYIYAIEWSGNASRGMMSVLYNTEGKPMTLEEFKKGKNN